MIKIKSKRLIAIASLVDKDVYLADIGSDHALLPIYLFEKGQIKWCQAVENKSGPYLRMKAAIKEAGFDSYVDCSLSDGLDELNDDVNSIVIAGMGGLKTIEILEKNKDKLFHVDSIIVDPHRDIAKVRKHITALGYHIEEEKILLEDRIYYSIIKFRKGKPEKPYKEEDYLFGPINLAKREEIFIDWLNLQKKKVNSILNGPALDKEKREYYLQLYRYIAKALKD